jgi:hypothetical protein
MSEAQDIRHEEHHRTLVRQLAAELKPARRLWPVSARMGLLIALEVGILAWVIAHTNNPPRARLAQPIYSFEVLLFAGAALVFAVMALRSAIPGRILGAREATLAGIFVTAGVVLLMFGQPMSTSEPLAEFLRAGLRCAYLTSIFAALPWLTLWWMVKRGAPMSGQLSGWLIGAGALSFSFAMMRLACPSDERLHLLTWHLLPALLLTIVSAIAGTAWLRFRPRSSKSPRAGWSGSPIKQTSLKQ